MENSASHRPRTETAQLMKSDPTCVQKEGKSICDSPISAVLSRKNVTENEKYFATLLPIRLQLVQIKLVKIMSPPTKIKSLCCLSS